MHAEGAVHVTMERLVLGAMLMALDQVPAGPVVVDVVVGAVARLVAVVVGAALGVFLLLLHPAARNESAMTAARDAVMGPTRLT